MLLDFLGNIGLTQKEAFLYELLLKSGDIGVGALIKEAKLKRATVYKTLYSLKKKGLVTQEERAKKIHFKPEPPAKLASIAESQLQNLTRAKASLEAILPSLASNYILSVERPVISTFEGIEALKEIYEDTLREGKPIYALLRPGTQEEKLHTWLERSYVKRRAKLGIHAYVIAATTPHAREYFKRSQRENRTVRLVPEIKFPFQHEINIYGDKIAILSNRKGEHQIGLLIRHPSIAKTMKAWFDLAWESAEKLSPQG